MKLTVSDLLDIGVVNPEKFVIPLNTSLEIAKINTIDRFIGAFMNLLHESGNFFYLSELASGKKYEGRKDLGNVNVGDGVKFKGRGAIQLSGRYNYRDFTKWLNLKGLNPLKINFEINPEKLEEPYFACLSFAFFWEQNQLNKYCDKQEWDKLMSVINTGRENGRKVNGVKDRYIKMEKLEKWIIKVATAT